ncbi:MAG TPA: glycine oxidase ThiO [Terriglobales bacterium]|nr:glycine oxidase ThiO [Terriglobales bacterium]
MKSWEVIIAGGGIVGISLARELRKHGASVLIIERGEPGHEASYAAAGMLAYCDPMLLEPLKRLAQASASMYPEFVHEIEDESGMRVDLRAAGTIVCFGQPAEPVASCVPVGPWRRLGGDEIAQLEPQLAYSGEAAYWTPEGSVDPRALVAASVKAAKHRGIDFVSGSAVSTVEVENGRAVAVRTNKARYAAGVVVNCCGAWAGQVGPLRFPTRPIKGQMLCVVAAQHGLINHVVRSPEVYVVPRSDGRILIGSTLEDAGFDKRVDPETIQRLHQAASIVIPDIGEARMLETWVGLRPGTPDALPLLGATEIRNYFVATGHYRDGILLAPVTALLMSQLLRGCQPDFDLSAFSPARF